METAAGKEWFLRKHEDGSIFGPLPFERLSGWASAAQIAPHDALSTDQQTWTKAPMVPQLGMDWLVKVTSERYYGPTTLGAIQEFIRLGEINAETFIINSRDGTRKQIAEMPVLLHTPQPAREVEGAEVAVNARAGRDGNVDQHQRSHSRARAKLAGRTSRCAGERRTLSRAREKISRTDAEADFVLNVTFSRALESRASRDRVVKFARSTRIARAATFVSVHLP